MIGKTVCHYKILEELGGGGMGVVYRAVDTRLKRTVALKFLAPELTRDERAKRRFVTEAQAASMLDHPNICTIHEIEEAPDGQLFLVMSCYEGETVKDRLERGPMPVDEAVGLAIHVARGLEAAHSRGIVHRDVKSANIFLTNDGRAKILDFGLAKLTGQTKVTRAGGTVGTVAYMSPEQARGGDVQASTDIWSLGVVLYETLTGELPFPGERPESVLYSVVHEEPRRLGERRHDVPPELEAIVEKCLKKDPEERFASASDLASALEPLRRVRASGSSLIEIGSTTRIRTEPARVRGLTAAAVVVVLACAGFFALPQGRSAIRALVSGRELPDVKELAVLPFRDTSDDGANAAFVDGVRRHLTFRLSQLERLDPSFRVIPADELDRHKVTTPEEALGVSGATLALSGTVGRSGDRVSISLELIDPRTLRVLKPWQCQDDLANVAALQEDPVAAVEDMLELAPDDRDRRTPLVGGTTVPGAFDCYIRGLGRLFAAADDSTDHLEDAIALFETATSLDPSFALAHADLGGAHWKAFVATDDQEELRQATESARRSVELGDRMAAAHVTLGLVKAQAEDYSQAIQEFRAALNIDPLNLEARRELADVSTTAGDLALAEITLNEAVDLRGNHWASHYRLGLYYYSRGRNDDALRVLSDASALAPRNAWPYILIGAVYFDADRLDEAWAMWERSAELAPTSEAYSNLGTSYFVESRYADAARMYEAALELDDTHYVTWGNLAAACGVVPGEEERASQCYARALELAAEQLRFSPRDEGLLASMAVYSASIDDTAGARDFVARSMELNPSDAHVMFEIGLTHEILGNRATALKWIGRSLDNGFSREQVESTPALREFCADERYPRLAQAGET